jgi:NADP-dependent 3-hydroxy acid dehydrogenase YdfG
MTRLDHFVVNIDNDLEKLKRLKKQIEPLTLVSDVRDSERIKECVIERVLKFGSVDCAIDNACRCTFESMDKTDEDTYRDVFNVNYF